MGVREWEVSYRRGLGMGRFERVNYHLIRIGNPFLYAHGTYFD